MEHPEHHRSRKKQRGMNRLYRANYHTHSDFCDGKGKLSDYVEQALEKKFMGIGFSSHVPLPFHNSWSMQDNQLQKYFQEVKKLKREFEGKISIYLSLEMDYISDMAVPAYRSDVLEQLDYVAGSVHYLRFLRKNQYLTVDGCPKEYKRLLKDGFDGSVRDMVSAYYSSVREMLYAYKPTFVAHLDLIKKNNPGGIYFSGKESWYREEVYNTLETAAHCQCAIELNTGGMARAGMDTYYPEKWALLECRNLGIPVVLNSDAHRPDQLDAFFDIAIRDLKEIGYTYAGFPSMQWLP